MPKPKKIIWKTDRWNGGESDDSRIGYRGAAKYLVSFEIFQDSALLQVSRKPVKHSDTTVAKLIKWFEIRPSNGDVYMYAEDKIYKETGGTYSTARTLSGDSPNGQGLCEFNGALYYRTATQLGRTTDYAAFTDNWQTGLTSCADFSPMIRFKNFLLVGHGRYVATVDDVGTFTLARLTLPPGYNVRDMWRVGTYVAIVAIRGTALTDSEEGLMFLWDGTSQNYNDVIPLDGNPHFVIAQNNTITLLVGGLEPLLQESYGGPAQTRYALPNIGIGKTIEVYPGAKDIFRGKVYFGISAGTSTDAVRVVRAYGSKNVQTEKVISPEFPISTGTLVGTGVQITAVKRVGTTLRYAWKDGSNYGVDQIDMTSFQTSAVYRSLVHDRESGYVKNPYRVLVELKGALAANETVTFKLGSDPYGDPTFANVATTLSQTQSTVGAKTLELSTQDTGKMLKSRDLHYELTLAGTGSTRPAVKRVLIEYDEEDDVLGG